MTEANALESSDSLNSVRHFGSAHGHGGAVTTAHDLSKRDQGAPEARLFAAGKAGRATCRRTRAAAVAGRPGAWRRGFRRHPGRLRAGPIRGLQAAVGRAALDRIELTADRSG